MVDGPQREVGLKAGVAGVALGCDVDGEEGVAQHTVHRVPILLEGVVLECCTGDDVCNAAFYGDVSHVWNSLPIGEMLGHGGFQVVHEDGQKLLFPGSIALLRIVC
eukprot:CAMPEP_0175937614 /NCGR_PEP_ID=MMETSP0108-20121206/22241_1 /TAXON_ID=195067 ORGANISM="Goniomonas pacifica, Strain CCMP1869" /NCGR_SAMPLE_ID=MMETSP0108 /ASSEMBLY_ACC=CAM_ASM_000204 /LENGTH=105 /DNA_ID=CAMNT_0017261779 /DNA_START=358 /DNA_END=675 /DNA_ORIENTATION=-